MITHIFFDFFGTLVDYDPSVHPVRNAPLAFARRAGSRSSEDDLNALWQMTWDELDGYANRTGREFSMQQVAQRFWRAIGSPQLSPGAIDTLVAEYLDAWTINVSLAADTVDCIADLAAGYTLGIVSNTHDPEMVPRLTREFGLHHSVDHVVTSVDIGWRKPHPTIFESALRQFNVPARNAVYVGDNWGADVEGPRRVGMSAVYVGPPTKERPAATLKEVPDIVRTMG